MYSNYIKSNDNDINQFITDKTIIIPNYDYPVTNKLSLDTSFINDGKIWWTGNKEDLFNSNNIELNNFVFASKLFKRLKK